MKCMKLFDIEKIKITSILPYFVIVVIALIYALPQLQIRGIYVGADNAFHFNRAFEAMSRIKNLNFNNSQISLYGFNASGRIVNALYGPGLGYFFGLVLLLTKSWLKFQLVTNFILTIGTMGLSYWLFNKYSKQSFLSLVFAILLSLTSYWSIGYWYQSSGGMTWGMMLFPLVLDAGMQMCTNKNDPVKVFRLGVVMALILESHMLSFVFSVGVLSVFFVLGMIVNNNRLILFRRSLFAAIISLGLTLGYWADYISIMRTQSILNPFVNLNPGNLSSNLYQGLAFWLLILSIVLIIGLSCKLLVWQWLLFIVGFIFLLVASGPKFILDNWNNVGFLRTVQFPMRFTLPGLYLLSFFVVTMLARLVKELSLRRSSVLAIGVGMLLLASMTIKSAFLNYYGANQRFWQDTNYVISKFSVAKNNQTLMPQMIIQSKNKNFEKSIDVINFAAPDYLPGNGDVHYGDKNYGVVNQEIISTQSGFNRNVTKTGNLIVSWHQNAKYKITVPVILYHQSVVKFNGNKINFNTTNNGVLKLMGQSGENTVEVSIQSPIVVQVAKLSPIVVLILVIGFSVFKRRKR